MLPDITVAAVIAICRVANSRKRQRAALGRPGDSLPGELGKAEDCPDVTGCDAANTRLRVAPTDLPDQPSDPRTGTCEPQVSSALKVSSHPDQMKWEALNERITSLAISSP